MNKDIVLCMYVYIQYIQIHVCILCVLTYTHTYRIEYYVVMEKKGILLFVETWVKLECSMLNEVNQTKNSAWSPLYVGSKLKKNKVELIEMGRKGSSFTDTSRPG